VLSLLLSTYKLRGHASDSSINVIDNIMLKQSHIQHSRTADTLLYDIPGHVAPCPRLSVEFFMMFCDMNEAFLFSFFIHRLFLLIL